MNPSHRKPQSRAGAFDPTEPPTEPMPRRDPPRPPADPLEHENGTSDRLTLEQLDTKITRVQLEVLTSYTTLLGLVSQTQAIATQAGAAAERAAVAAGEAKDAAGKAASAAALAHQAARTPKDLRAAAWVAAAALAFLALRHLL